MRTEYRNSRGFLGLSHQRWRQKVARCKRKARSAWKSIHEVRAPKVRDEIGFSRFSAPAAGRVTTLTVVPGAARPAAACTWLPSFARFRGLVESSRSQ